MPRRSADADGPPADAPATTKPAPATKAKPRRKGASAPRSNTVDHVHVADDALATIIGLAAHEVPGVVGMAPSSLSEGLRRILGVSQVDEGVDIDRSEDGASARVGLHVVVAYGVNIPAVAESVVQRVRYAARTFAGVAVDDVKVHVAGVSRG